MDYRFLSQSDEELIRLSELPTSDGIAMAVRSTGYDAGEDEIVQLAIVDLDGNELFNRTVKPQNVEAWTASEASGGIGPADVEDAPELYQFEEEISDLFENASIVVAAHLSFAEAMVESSWVTLPAFEGCDIVPLFLASHSTADAPNEPATAAGLVDIAEHYDVELAGDSALADARAVAAAYRAFVEEHVRERKAKGDAYWERYEQRKAEEAAAAQASNAAAQSRERFLNRMNGLLWVAGGIIFTSLVIQTNQGGGDTGLMLVFGIVAAFCYIRGVVNLRK